MKNLRFGLLAAIIAIGMSSFSESKAKFANYYYQVGSTWLTYSSADRPCPEGDAANCVIEIGGVNRQLFTAQDLTKPLKRD
jgi:hypothetical protein